jgi:hypothetical protein
METDYVVDNYSIDSISFSGKLRKQGEYLISKVKYKNADLTIQLPKMKIKDILENKNIELEFTGSSKYSKTVQTFLSKMDEHILNNIFKNSEEWFNKKIPMDKLESMYTKIVKESALSCTIKKATSNSSSCVLVDNKNNELNLEDYKKDSVVEGICRMKYIVFSKDRCFTVWDLIVMKLHRKMQKVPKFGFIEDDPEDNNSDNEIEDIDYSFF